MSHAIFGDTHSRVGAVHKPEDLPVELSPEAPHRLRRAEDTEELRIREEVWQHFKYAVNIGDTNRPSFMAALDEYRHELGLMALRRLGVGGTK